MGRVENMTGGISLDLIPEQIFEEYERSAVPTVFGPWADRLVEAAGMRPGERVLDLACGTGIVARKAAEHVGEEGSVTGLDMLPGMLEVARAASRDVRPQIEWVEGDALQMPLPDGSFDVVLCQQGAQFFPDKVAAFTEARRVLKPDGRMILSVWRSIERSPGVAALQRALKQHTPDAAGFLLVGFSLADAEELRGYLSKAGFGDVSVRIEVSSVRFDSVDDYLRTYFGATPLAGIVAGLPEERRRALAEDVTGALREYVDDEGLTFPQEANVAFARR